MRRQLVRCALFLAAALVTTSASAGSPQGFDVAGFRLGMSVGEIEAAAAALGLLEKGRRKAPSFEQTVMMETERRVEARNFAGLRKLKFESDTIRVEVDFVSMPEGPKAHAIHYVVRDPDLTADKLSADIEAKYGSPDQRGDRKWLWGDTAPFPLRETASLEYHLQPSSFGAGPKPVGSLLLRDPNLPRAFEAAVKAAAS